MYQNTKSATTAGLLGIFLGAFGAHNWYLGEKGKGIAHVCMMSGGVVVEILAAAVLPNVLSFTMLVQMAWLFTILTAAAGLAMSASALWGLIEGITILSQGDAGLARKGYAVAEPMPNYNQPMNNYGQPMGYGQPMNNGYGMPMNNGMGANNMNGMGNGMGMNNMNGMNNMGNGMGMNNMNGMNNMGNGMGINNMNGANNGMNGGMNNSMGGNINNNMNNNTNSDNNQDNTGGDNNGQQ